jgi:hypothetical protein
MPYVTLAPVGPPGSLIYGYQAGEVIADEVVENWQLDETQVKHVEPGAENEAVPAEPTAVEPVRPGPEANRAEMEAYAVAIGAMSAEEAADASQDDLWAVESDSTDEPAPETSDRPTDSALKAEWVEYVVRAGADEPWARDKATTKDDLMAWQPAAGDTVAVSASERQAASQS